MQVEYQNEIGGITTEPKLLSVASRKHAEEKERIMSMMENHVEDARQMREILRDVRGILADISVSLKTWPYVVGPETWRNLYMSVSTRDLND